MKNLVEIMGIARQKEFQFIAQKYIEKAVTIETETKVVITERIQSMMVTDQNEMEHSCQEGCFFQEWGNRRKQMPHHYNHQY